MGSAQTRQQALSPNGLSGSTLAGVPAAATNGSTLPPTTGATVPSNATPVVDGDERLSVVFTWPHGGQNVFLAASFNGWRERIPMVRSGNEFNVVQDIPRGVHQYKFIVDDTWRFAPDQPKTQDGKGNMNNVCDVANYQYFEVDTQDDAAPRFLQQIPDPQSYMQDAPVVPTVLDKSIFCAADRQLGGQSPYMPLHSFCDHIYLRTGAAQSDEPTQLVVTHRYAGPQATQRYSTTVFATRSPGLGAVVGESLPDPALARRSRNSLKEAVIRPSSKQ